MCLHAEREPQPSNLLSYTLTVKDVYHHFLTYQFQEADVAQISPRWFEYCPRSIRKRHEGKELRQMKAMDIT